MPRVVQCSLFASIIQMENR